MRLFSDGHPVLRQDSVLDISIIGAGVSGLSTGIRLLEAGHDVTIFTECISPDTVSDTKYRLVVSIPGRTIGKNQPVVC